MIMDILSIVLALPEARQLGAPSHTWRNGGDLCRQYVVLTVAPETVKTPRELKGLEKAVSEAIRREWGCPGSC